MTAIAKAASVLVSAGPGSQELYIVRRAPSLRFFGGFLAFPGGRVAAEDAWPEHAPDPEAARRVAAARELFEETGILLARRPNGEFLTAQAGLDYWRRELLAERVSFRGLLQSLGLGLHEADLISIGSLTTPAFASSRFDTHFFLAHMPPGQKAEVWPGELDAGWWTSSSAVLDEWEHGGSLVSPPTVACLQAIRHRAVDEAPGRLSPLCASIAAGAMHPIYFAPRVRMLPLRTDGLLPNTFTNAYLVGEGPAYLIDPGPTDPEEQSRLFAVLDQFHDAGHRLTAILLTHHHRDHVGAADVCAKRYGIPVRAHPMTARMLGDRATAHEFIHDGETFPLGVSPDGVPRRLEAVFTPGHASGHLAFYQAHYQLLFVGDLLSMVSTVVIEVPDGDLAAYLESLRRLRGLPCRLLLPGHGNVSARPTEAIDDCLAHRAQREQMLLAALRPEPRTIEDLALELYKGLPNGMMRFAEMQVRAGLEKLHHEGRAEAVSADRLIWRGTGAP